MLAVAASHPDRDTVDDVAPRSSWRMLAAHAVQSRRSHLFEENPMQLPTIDLACLANVTGGLNAKVSTPLVSGEITAPDKPQDPDKQLRCYGQVASQAGMFQGSRETLRQQMQLCGPLRQ
jgi:hypothetical protein